MFFGGQRSTPRGPDATITLKVTLEELYQGSKKTTSIERNVICRKCRGTGAKDGKVWIRRIVGSRLTFIVDETMQKVRWKRSHSRSAENGNRIQCPSSATLPEMWRTWQNIQKEMSTLSWAQSDSWKERLCRGNWKRSTFKSQNCVWASKWTKSRNASGQRHFPVAYRTTFSVPVRLSPYLLNVANADFDCFSRSEDDLHHTMEISLQEALLGYDVSIVHLDGRKVHLQYDKIVKPFEVRTIEGEGMPHFNYPSDFGNLHLHHLIKFPTSLTSEQKDLVKKLLSE